MPFPKYKSIHCVGVLSPSLAAIALYARCHGITVSGSDDRTDDRTALRLRAAGVTVFDCFAQVNTTGAEAVVLSRFFDPTHSEAVAAAGAGLAIFGEVEFLSQLVANRPTLAVIGAYEAPLVVAWLEAIGRRVHIPLETIGAAETNGPVGTNTQGPIAVALSGMKRSHHAFEPDFLAIDAQTIILPSLMYDYPELYSTLDDVYEAYYRFVRRVPRTGYVIANGDWSRIKRLRTHMADRAIASFGFDRDADWPIYDLSESEEQTTFSLKRHNRLIGPLTIPFRGRLFVASAAAVAIFALEEGVSLGRVAAALTELPACARYFETNIDRAGRLIIDDCADHPSTIEDVLAAVKSIHPGKKIWCLYQSGSYMRSKTLQADFEDSLAAADFVYLADICGPPKEKSEGIHARHLVASLRARRPNTYYFESVDDMAALLDDRVAIQDCIVTLGVSGPCQAATARLLG